MEIVQFFQVSEKNQGGWGIGKRFFGGFGEEGEQLEELGKLG